MIGRRLSLALGFWLALSAGCGGGYGAAWRAGHPGFSPAPLRSGASFAETLAALDLPPAEGTRVSVTELRVLRVTDAAWLPISPEVAETETGTVGASVARRCTHWDGWRRAGFESASWYIFERGRLIAFDHTEFDADCTARRSFRPSRPEAIETEQALVRWIAQRHPASRLSTEDRLRRGRALVEAGRIDEAQRALRDGDRAIDDLSRERKRTPEDQEELRLALQEREDGLRALRSLLERAIETRRAELRRERGAPGSPNDTSSLRPVRP